MIIFVKTNCDSTCDKTFGLPLVQTYSYTYLYLVPYLVV